MQIMEGVDCEIHLLLNMEESAWESVEGKTGGSPPMQCSERTQGVVAGTGSWVPLTVMRESRQPLGPEYPGVIFLMCPQLPRSHTRRCLPDSMGGKGSYKHMVLPCFCPAYKAHS